MPKSFTKTEKENIRINLQKACKQSWTKYGYKKTSVDELCRQTGISKGAFYLFYESKEDLFCEVLCSVQEQIYSEALKIINNQKDKYGVANALKLIYREYDNNNFLYNSDSIDFTIFMNRLSEEQSKKIEESNNKNQQLFCNDAYLKFNIDKDMAMSIIYSLIMNIKNKDILPHNHIETFDFMVDHLIDSIYGQKEEENEDRNYKKK